MSDRQTHVEKTNNIYPLSTLNINTLEGIRTLLVHLLIDCIGINDTSTLVGHFVTSPREREKRDKRDSRDEREEQGRKRNRNKN